MLVVVVGGGVVGGVVVVAAAVCCLLFALCCLLFTVFCVVFVITVAVAAVAVELLLSLSSSEVLVKNGWSVAVVGHCLLLYIGCSFEQTKERQFLHDGTSQTNE